MALQALRRKHVVSTVVLALALVAVGVARDIPSGMPVQAGWLYVVDANNGAESASVWIVDPERQEVVGRLGTGYRPDIAVSRDGTRLYLAHGVREPGQVDFSDVVDVIDTANGTLVKRVESEDRSISTLPLYWPLMVVSDDDRWLFQMKQKARDDGVTEYSIGTLDLTTLRFLPERAPVPMCFTGMLLPQPGNGARLAVVCSQTEDLRLL